LQPILIIAVRDRLEWSQHQSLHDLVALPLHNKPAYSCHLDCSYNRNFTYRYI